MNFERHLFISYAHIDNQPLTPGQQGWISQFHASLEAMLSMRMGRRAEIWRDQKLQGNDVFADEIVQQFPKTAVLLSVLTPRYVESDWCTREIEEFCKAAEHSGGLTLDNKARVIKVVKTPVDGKRLLPPLLQQMLGYDFFTFVDEAPLELDPAFGPEMAQKYNLKLAKLAWDIAQLLKKLNAAEENVKVPASSKPVVYLAECSYDRREFRETLEADLQLNGYQVLPDRPLPRDEADYIAEVTRLLEKCKLSIHLVGSGAGAVPDGPSQKPAVVLQNEMAVERSKSNGLKRVIWLPEGTSSGHAEQQRFIEALRQDAQAQFGADLVAGDIESFKGAVHAALRKLERPDPARAERNGNAPGAKLLYIICDEKDRQATIPLRKFLRGAGLEVKIPLFEGDAATVRQANQDLLSQCDAVLVFYGAGGEAWKRTVDNDLKRMKAYRGEKSLLANFVFLAGPSTADKNDLIELEEPNVIDGLRGIADAGMEPFLSEIRRE
jgi:TIR domain